MSQITWRRKLLTAGAAACASALSASAAFADNFELSYSTTAGSGTIFFTVGGHGATTGLITNVTGSETMTGSSGAPIKDSGIAQSVTGPVAALSYTNFKNGMNDNDLVAFTPTPPSTNTSSSDTTWFSSGGFAFLAADGTVIDVYNAAIGHSGAKFIVEATDNTPSQNVLIGTGSGVATLADLGAPGPTPGGPLGFAFLALAALAVKRREIARLL